MCMILGRANCFSQNLGSLKMGSSTLSNPSNPVKIMRTMFTYTASKVYVSTAT